MMLLLFTIKPMTTVGNGHGKLKKFEPMIIDCVLRTVPGFLMTCRNRKLRKYRDHNSA